MDFLCAWSAGVGEEYICRNWLIPILDYKYGQRKGLIFSSLTFGVLHFSNVLFADKPDYGEALLQVGEATIAGYFLGRDVQKRDYNIGPAVAAHMWYDAVLMIGSFLINPKDNSLEEMFGDEWDVYCKNVGKYLPKLFSK